MFNRRLVILILLVGTGIGVVWLAAHRPLRQVTEQTPEPTLGATRDSAQRPASASVPTATQPSTVSEPTPTVTVPLPKNALIANVPFIEQAPHKNWDATHEETCEEAASLAVATFWQGKRSLSADTQERELQAMIAWEKANLGVFEDTTAAQTAELLRGYFNLGDRVRLVHNATPDDLKRELVAGRPVIVPAAGRLIGNRYFQTPGPIYHMTVAIGYTQTQIITNDPGTRRGKDYAYPIDQFWNAVHDFVDRTDAGMAQGEKVLIVVDPA